jgi:hypothetical protein
MKKLLSNASFLACLSTALPVCLLVLACVPADTRQLASPASGSPSSVLSPATQRVQEADDAPSDIVAADNREIKLARLGTPSLIWREGPVTILQYAGMAETRGMPDCTLLIFLDEQGQQTSVQTRPASGTASYEPMDEKSCLRAWRRKRN